MVDDPATDAGAHNYSEDNFSPLPCSGDGLRDGEAVGVVLDDDIAGQALLEVGEEGLSVEAGGVGILHGAVTTGDGAWGGDPDGGAFWG